jgi:hypothetical protein
LTRRLGANEPRFDASSHHLLGEARDVAMMERHCAPADRTTCIEIGGRSRIFDERRALAGAVVARLC